MTFYGSKPPPDGDHVPDWLMGGNRKRRVVQSLADEIGCSAEQLVTNLDCGRSTVYETIRALRAVDVIETLDGGLMRLNRKTPVGTAIAGLADALRPLDGRVVDRPPRPRTNAIPDAGTQRLGQPRSSASDREHRLASDESPCELVLSPAREPLVPPAAFVSSVVLWGAWLRSLGEPQGPCRFSPIHRSTRHIPRSLP